MTSDEPYFSVTHDPLTFVLPYTIKIHSGEDTIFTSRIVGYTWTQKGAIRKGRRFLKRYLRRIPKRKDTIFGNNAENSLR